MGGLMEGHLKNMAVQTERQHSAAGIELKNVKKCFQVDGKELPVLKDICLEIPEQRITVLLGKSGCGKTTLLRIVGGLETEDAGEVIFHASHRTAYVFQEPRLMPWLNVWDNVAFGLEKKEIRREELERIIQVTGLSGFEKAMPRQLSGGMQHRTAMARALAYHPSFIMMDEPFASLDYFTRRQMQQELLRVQKEQQTSILFVTHSIDEALVLADRIAIMADGRIKTVCGISGEKGKRDLMSDGMIALRKEILHDLEIRA